MKAAPDKITSSFEALVCTSNLQIWQLRCELLYTGNLTQLVTMSLDVLLVNVMANSAAND